MLQCPFLTPFRTACLSLAQRLINTKGKAATVHFTSAEAASSLHLARCSDTVQLLQDDRSDPQQRHVDEEVAHGGEDVAAHLPPQLLRVHLGPQPLDAEHAAGPAPLRLPSRDRRRRAAGRAPSMRTEGGGVPGPPRRGLLGAGGCGARCVPAAWGSCPALGCSHRALTLAEDGRGGAFPKRPAPNWDFSQLAAPSPKEWAALPRYHS